MKIFRVFLYVFLMALVSCSPGNNKDKEKIQAAPSEYRFILPEIPVMYSTPESQTKYLAEHFWDHFNFNDSVDLEGNKFVEEAFVRYLMIMIEIEPMKAGAHVLSLMEKASANNKLSMYFAARAEKYLFDPNSPVRNELLYEAFLKGILANPSLDELTKLRFINQFDWAQKNKPGTKATDFQYRLKNGNSSSLYQTRGQLIMLYFFNPDCHECAATRDRIVGSQVIQSLQTKGLLSILALYPDKDLSIWEKHYADYPATWILAYDQKMVIENDQLYDLKAIPTIYLLDADKTVLLRDPTFEQFEGYLNVWLQKRVAIK